MAGMDGRRAALIRSRDDPRNIEIAVARRGRADRIGLIGHGRVERARISFGIDGDGPYPKSPSGASDAASDLAAISDEDLAEHYIRKTPKWDLPIGALRL